MKKLIVSTLFAAASLAASTTWAHPQYIVPANAVGSCADCHIGGTRSKNFVPGLIKLFPINQNLTIQEKIKAIFKLTDAQRKPVWDKWNAIINPKPTTPDTAPVLRTAKRTYIYTIGGKPLVVPFRVVDKEKDTYTIQEGFTDDVVISKPRPFNKNNLSTFSITWKDIPAEYAGETFPMEISVKEDQRKKGRILKSNVVKFNIRVVKGK